MSKLSVILLCHNNARIDWVVESVAPQLLEGEELFLVDDYSHIETKEKIAILQRKYQNMTVLRPPQKGNRSLNRNIAAAKASGERLVFIDGDVVIEEGAIEKLRNADLSGVSGACGAVAAMRALPETVAIAAKRFDGEICTRPIDFEEWHKRNPDERVKSARLPWNRFYTAFSVVPKETFFAVGGFDESFFGWGGEDVDLGYRLSKVGSLLCVNEWRGVHIPHRRNLLEEEKSGRKNMYRMLAKYRNLDMEELLSFALSPTAHEGLKEVFAKMQNTEEGELPLQENELAVFAASTESSTGKIAYRCEGERKEERLMGLALPFADKQFALGKATTNVFAYPEGVCARILQEILRVCQSLRVYKRPPVCVDWGEIADKFRYLFCYYKIYAFCDGYQDFDITDCGEYYEVKIGASGIVEEKI